MFNKLRVSVLFFMLMFYPGIILGVNEPDNSTIRCEFRRGELPSTTYSSRNQQSAKSGSGYQLSHDSSGTLKSSETDSYRTKGGASSNTVGADVSASNSMGIKAEEKISSDSSESINISLADIHRKVFPESIVMYFQLSNNGNDLYYIYDEFNKTYLENAEVSTINIFVNIENKEINIDRITGKSLLKYTKGTENGNIEQSYSGACVKSDFKRVF